MEGENNDYQKGLYIPQLEKDSCGTGLIANLKGNKNLSSFQKPTSLVNDTFRFGR